MGMGKLSQITSIFTKLGKESIPVAVIQDGTLPSQRSVIGEVRNIENLVAENDLSPPAIIIIGDVVKSASELQKKVEEITFDYAS